WPDKNTAEGRRISSPAFSVSKKYFRPAVRILKRSKSFKILLIERAVGFLPPAHTPAALSRTSSAGFFDSLRQETIVSCLSVSKKYFRPAVRILKLSKKFQNPV